MSNVLIIGKKAFTWTTVVATIAWAMSLAFLAVPLTASAVTLSAGDMIIGTAESTSGAGRPVYYYGSDAKRYLFPSENTYKSWFGLDWSLLTDVTEAELQAIPFGGNVTAKPGSLVQYVGPDAGYYVIEQGGSRRAITAADAATIYGADYATADVYSIPEAFQANYPAGTAATASFSPATAAAASPDIGTDLSLAATSTPAAVTGTLNFSLASDNPAAAVLPTGSTSVVVLKVNIAGNGAAQTIDSMKFKVTGVGATTDISALYLFDGATRLTTGRTVSSQTRTSEFNNLALAIAANTTKTLSLVADIRGTFNSTGTAQTAATNGDTHAFSLDSVGTTASVAGVATVVGNTYSIGSQGVSRVTLQRLTDAGDPTIGTVGSTLADFRLTAGTNDVDFQRATITIGGGVSVSDLSNLTLYQGSDKVADGTRVSDRVTFELPAGYTLTQGSSRTFTVKADIAGRGNRTISSYIDSSYPTDLLVVDKVYNYGALGTFNSYREVCTAAATPTTCGSFVTTVSGRVTVALTGPVAGDVSPGDQDATLFTYSMTAADQAVEIRRSAVTIAGQAGGFVDGSSGTNYFSDIKIKNVDTGSVLMGPQEHVAAASATTSGEVAFTDTWTLNANQTVNLAITADLSRTEDATADEYLGEAYAVTLSAFTTTSVREVSTGQYLAVADIVGGGQAIQGQNQTVQSSSLTVSRASTPTSQTTVVGSTNVETVGYSFVAGDGSAIKVSRIILAGEGHDTANTFTLDSTATLDDTVLSVSLWDGSTQVGATRSPNSSGNVTFDSLDWTVPAGGTKKLTVKTSVNTTVTSDNADLAYLSLPVANITAQDADGDSVTATAGTPNPNLGITDRTATGAPANFLTINPVGTLRVARQGDTAISAIVIGGASDVPMLRVRFTPTEESFNIKKVRVVNTAAADDVGITKVKVRYPTQSGALETKEVDLTNGSADVSGMNFYATRDQNNVLEILTDLVAINQANVSSLTPQFGLDFGMATDSNFEAVGVGSGTSITTCADANLNTTDATVTCDNDAGDVDVNGNAMTLRQTVPTVSLNVSSPSGVVMSSETAEVLRFTVAADSHGALLFNAVTFGISASDNAGTNWNQAAALLVTDFDIYDTSDMQTALDTTAAGADWVLYQSTGNQLVSGTTATDVGYVRLTFPTARQIARGSSKTYAVFVNFGTGALPGTGANQLDSLTMSVAQEQPSTLTALEELTTVNMFDWSEDSPVGATNIAGTLVKNLPFNGHGISLD